MKPLQVLAVTGASGNGAQLHEWELDLWPEVVELIVAPEQQGSCRFWEPYPTLQRPFCLSSYTPASAYTWILLLLPQSQ